LKGINAHRTAITVTKLLASRNATFQEFQELILDSLATSPSKSHILRDVLVVKNLCDSSSLHEGVVKVVCDDANLQSDPHILGVLVEQNRTVELARLLAVSPPPVKPSTFYISGTCSEDVIKILVDYEERYIREVYAPSVEAKLREFRQEGADDKMETPYSILACLYSHLPLTNEDFGWDYTDKHMYIEECLMHWDTPDRLFEGMVVEPGILRSRSFQQICIEKQGFLSIAKVAKAVHSAAAMEIFTALLTDWPAIEMPLVLEAALGIALANGKSDLVRLFKEHGFPSQ